MTALVDTTAEPQSGARLSAKRLSLSARRALVATIGGVLALGGGAGVAFAFRIAPETATDPVEQTVADELPSVAAARAYALQNPPSYGLPAKAPGSDAPLMEQDTDAALDRPADDAADQAAPPPSPQPYVAATNDDEVAPAAHASTSSDGGQTNPS